VNRLAALAGEDAELSGLGKAALSSDIENRATSDTEK
jgi:hypothetical protein